MASEPPATAVPDGEGLLPGGPDEPPPLPGEPCRAAPQDASRRAVSARAAVRAGPERRTVADGRAPAGRGTDAGVGTGLDAGAGAGVDVEADVHAGMDAGMDAGVDADMDAGVDVDIGTSGVR